MQAKDGFISFERAVRHIRFPEKTKLDIKNIPREMERGLFSKLVLWLSPLCMFLAFGGYFYFYVINPSPMSTGNSIMMIMLLTMGGGAIAGLATQLVRSFNAKKEKKTYKARLAHEEKRLAQYVKERKIRLLEINPAPNELLRVIWERKFLWERLPKHLDFLNIRLGLAKKLESGVEFNLPDLDNNFNPSEMEELTLQLREKYCWLHDVPAMVTLNKVGALGIAGPPHIRVSLARSIVAQIVTYHSPEDVRLVALYPPNRAEEWFWLGWLPHFRPIRIGGEYPSVAYDTGRVEQEIDWINKELNDRDEKSKNTGAHNAPSFCNLVVLVDDNEQLQNYQTILKHLMTNGTKRNIYFIYLSSRISSIPPSCLATVEINYQAEAMLSVREESGEGAIVEFKPDQISVSLCDEVARGLAPIRLQQHGAGKLPPSVDLFSLWRSGDELTAEQLVRSWQNQTQANLRIVLGAGEDGLPLVIDLDESKQGCHGLLVGRSGSGKGELLLNFVTNLALNNSPNFVNLVLGDFKGGATFSVFEDLPHCVGYVTDLEKGGELEIVRVIEALETELARREHLITAAQKRYGAGVQKLAQYQKVAHDMEALPYLIVIFDEFGKMKELAPERVKDLAQIGMRGRSLGVFLLLAMQSPQGLIRGELDANIRYRIALKVNSPTDSQDVIKDKSAADVLSGEIPGRGFFRCDSTLVMFQSARVMSDALSRKGQIADSRPMPVRLGRNWLERQTAKPGTATMEVPTAPKHESLPDVEIAVKLIKEAVAKFGLTKPPHRPWFPPLPPYLGLTGQMREIFDQPGHFKGWREQSPLGWMHLPIAKLDCFWEQSQPLMISDLSRRHLQLLGNANSGRTTALLAAATGLAATHKPGDLEFILFDFGYSLKTLSGLPHNTIYFAASEEKERKAMLDDLLKEMNRRREAFGEVEKGVIISNLSDYRKYRQPKLKPEDELETAIVLVIDNFSYWRRSPDYDMCAHVLRNLIQAGPVYGIHILLTADKYTDIDYGRYWESFYSVMLQMDHADLFSQPQDKKMLALWNNKPGRGFVKGDPPRNLIEVQAFFLTTEPEKLQQAAVGKLVQEMFAVHKG